MTCSSRSRSPMTTTGKAGASRLSRRRRSRLLRPASSTRFRTSAARSTGDSLSAILPDVTRATSSRSSTSNVSVSICRSMIASGFASRGTLAASRSSSLDAFRRRAQGIAQLVTEQGQELIALPDVSLPLFQRGARRVLTGARPERRARGAHHRQRMDRLLERGDVAEIGERLQRLSVLERGRRPRHEDDERKVRPGRLVAKGSGERRDDREAERLLGHAARHPRPRRSPPPARRRCRRSRRSSPLLEHLGRQHRVATRGREHQQLVLPKGGVSHCRHGTHPPEARPRTPRTWERR